MTGSLDKMSRANDVPPHRHFRQSVRGTQSYFQGFRGGQIISGKYLLLGVSHFSTRKNPEIPRTVSVKYSFLNDSQGVPPGTPPWSALFYLPVWLVVCLSG